MTTIAGMDLGYGSQVKIVRTNYLVISDAANATVDGAKNALTLVQGILGPTKLRPDYVITEAITTSTDPVVLLSAATAVPMVGPNPAALHSATGTGMGSHNNAAAAIGGSANGDILAILSASMVEITIVGTTYAAQSDYDAHTYAAVGGGPASLTDLSWAEAINNAILADAANTGTIDISAMVTDALAACGADEDLADATLNADFVAPGNAAGTTPSALSAGNTMCVISIVGIVKTA